MTEGIYKITCVPTGDVYIGSSKRIEKRWLDHKSSLNRGVHHCTNLQDHWNVFGFDSFTHEVIELTLELEARECHWMEEYEGKLLNTSRVATNPMRNEDSVKKMLESRGGKQQGVGSSSAKLSEDKYLQIVYALTTTTYSPEDLSDYFGLSPRSIRDIANGSRHSWIKEQYPEQFKVMQQWRKNLRVFRAVGGETPEITLPIDTSFITQLHSFRRDYSWKTEAEAKLTRLKKDDKAKSKEIEKIERQLTKPNKGLWIKLINRDKELLEFYSAEEATAYGLKVEYLTQLKAGKLIRYKGWRIDK